MKYCRPFFSLKKFMTFLLSLVSKVAILIQVQCKTLIKNVSHL